MRSLGDITYCFGINCQLKHSCRRFLDKAKGNPYFKSFFAVMPHKNGKDCPEYWEVKLQKDPPKWASGAVVEQEEED